MTDWLSLMLHYQSMGVNALLVNEHKVPVHKWKKMQSRLLTPDEIRDLKTSRRGKSVYEAGVQGIALLHGSGTRPIRAFDLDDCPSYAPVAALLKALGLPDDYPWVVRTGSGKGWSVWVECAGDLPSRYDTTVLWGKPVTPGAFGHVELRWWKAFSLLPPSLHYSGGIYYWHNGAPTGPPARVEVEAVVKAFHAIARRIPPIRKKTEREPAPFTPPVPHELVQEKLQQLRKANNSVITPFPSEAQKEVTEGRIPAGQGIDRRPRTTHATLTSLADELSRTAWMFSNEISLTDAGGSMPPRGVDPAVAPIAPDIADRLDDDGAIDSRLPRAISNRRAAPVQAGDLARAVAMLKQLGYLENGENGEWLNGRCIFHEHHPHGDSHPSAGINLITGVYHCFVAECGNRPLSSVLARLDAPEAEPPQAGEDLPFTFSGGDEPPDDPSDVMTELNIAVALFKKGAYRTARFYPILLKHSQGHDGQHTYSTAALVALGADYGLNRGQVTQGIKQMVNLKLLRKRGRGVYQRVSVQRVQDKLGLTQEFGAIWLPRNAYTGSPSDYFRTMLLIIEHCLPGELATASLGQAAGVSGRTIYHHENHALITRKVNVRRTLAGATLSFAKTFDEQGDYRGSVGRGDAWSGDDIEYAARRKAGAEGTIWGWEQRPSTRILPSLQAILDALRAF